MAKMVINAAWGGYYIPQVLLDTFPIEHLSRTSPEFIEWVENHAGETDLAVVTIPDGATDTYIVDYDGKETLLAVVNGKIVECH